MSLQAHFRKAAAFHKKAAALHEKMADCHAALHDGEGSKAAALHGLAKNAGRESLEYFEVQGLQKSSGQHKALAEHHGALSKLHAGHADHLIEMAGASTKADGAEPSTELEKALLALVEPTASTGIDAAFRHLVGGRDLEDASPFRLPNVSMNKSDLPADFASLVGGRDME